jgi:hypothetical protein
MIMAILLIRRFDPECQRREDSAPQDGFGSSGIVRERCGKVPSKRMTATIQDSRLTRDLG